MFRNKKVQEFSFARISKKLLNDKDSIQRIKHLRCINDNIQHNELKPFFRKHYSLIFNAFYDVFMNVQLELQQKVNSTHYKELQNILGVFERILILLPELIHKKWQFNCISGIIRILIHPNNILKVRLQGVQLFVIWFQILGSNAPKLCYDIFTSVVPIFEPVIKKSFNQEFSSDNQQSVNQVDLTIPINEIEIKPVLTQNIDKEAEFEDEDQILLRYLLRYIVTESLKIEWEENAKEQKLSSQTFLFDNFKEYLLPVIFPKCASDYTIEKNCDMKLVTTEFLESYSPVGPKYPIDMAKICCYQEEVIRWLGELLNIDHPSLCRLRTDSFPNPSELPEESKRDTFSSLRSSNGQSKISSVDNVFVKFDKENLKIERPMLLQMHEILFKNEENVNIINQLCQHAFYLPLQFFKTHLSIILVYKSWLFSAEYKHPPFMLDENCSLPMEIKTSTTCNEAIVRISPTMQMIIFTNLGTVFMHRYKNELSTMGSSPTKKSQMSKQIHSDLAKKIIGFVYRRAVYNISNLANEHLMNVLLDIGFNVLSSFSPSNKPDNHWISTDAAILPFFQTLNVLMLMSNLISYISDDIWDRYLKVYSSLTDWEPLIIEWKKTLELILKMLGKRVYNVDMADLPLDKKEKRGRRPKKATMSKPLKKLSVTDDSMLAASNDQDVNPHSYKSNTMTEVLNFQPNSFIEGLNQNTDDAIICSVEKRNSINTKSDTKEMGETNKTVLCESNELDAGSFMYSSHEETSSYMSAEDSSSPHCKDKNIEGNVGQHSDNEFMPLSSSGGDTSMEGNSSFDTSIKPMYNDESEDLNIDADDESEGEIPPDNYFDVESKSATLTRDESDVDLSSQLYRFSAQDTLNDSSRTPTKHSNRRKTQPKRPDRNSMNIDDNIVNAISDPQNLANQILTTGNLNDHHILLGGTLCGWTQESAVLLWKRYIGLLGNITLIKNKTNLLVVFQHFLASTDSFIKMRENMCVPNGNQVTPTPPLYTPPIEFIAPWMFQAFKLDSIPDDVKLIALKTLCRMTVRKLDIEPSVDFLAQFYKLIHSVVHSENKIFIYNLIKNIGSHFFSMPLAGSEILIPDLIMACEIVLEISDEIPKNSEEIPKVEAVSLLGSMLKFQELHISYKVFDPTTKTINIIDSSSFKSEIVSILIKSAKNEPQLATQTLSIICISSHCFTELMALETSTSDLNDVRNCILLLLGLMRFENLEISTISVDMIRFLVNCCMQMQEKLSLIPEKIIQVLSWTINHAWVLFRKSMDASHKNFLTTAIFTLVDWCMNLPLSQLLDSNDLHSKGLIYLAFSALENVLKDYDMAYNFNSSTVSVKQLQTDKKPLSESKRISTVAPINQLGHFSELSNDPLLDSPHMIGMKTFQASNFNYDPKFIELVKLAARMGLCHLINNIGQFPKNNVLGGLSSCVQEHNDYQVSKVKSPSDGGLIENVTFDDLSSEVFNTSDLQMFVVNGSMLVSFIALNSKAAKLLNQSAPGGPPISRHMDNNNHESEVRVIIRDLCGKYCWDVTFVHKNENSSYLSKTNEEQENMPPSPPPRRTLPSCANNDKSTDSKISKLEKPTMDYVDMLLTDLTTMNPEIFSVNFPKSLATETVQSNLETLSKRQILDQKKLETEVFDNHHCLKITHPKLFDKKLRSSIPLENPPEPITPNSKFYFCRQILIQLGFLSWKRRASIDLVQKSNIFLHLKNIDQRRGRETHKIAVLYVAWGQEDKESILGNTSGSLEYNTFISGLGWTVNLENHKGFMGGLESSGRNGFFAPYYANSTLEIMFHVSTWMPSEKPEDKPNKFKHLGNDEVMVIWSENYRDFRSNITRTEFGDVMIIIYPLRNSLFAISIKTKADIKSFGPLFDGAIVGERELSVLVRATAINAGRKIRECKQHYQEFFVERANYLEKAIKKFCDPMSFEDFAEHIYGIRKSNTEESFPTTSSTEISPLANTSDNNKNIGFVGTDPASSLSGVDGNFKGRLRHSSSPKYNLILPNDRSQYPFDEVVPARKASKSYKNSK